MLSFRPHHFMCSLGFKGLGYSYKFSANMHRIVMETLRAIDGDITLITVTAQSDEICTPCPKRRGPICKNEAKIATLDAAHARALHLSAGDVLSWGEAKARMKTYVNPEDLQTLCAGCEWLTLGVCKQALRALHKKNAASGGKRR